MFIWFASVLPGLANDLFTMHPADLVALLDYAWDHRANEALGTGTPPVQETGDPRRRSEVPGLTGSWMGQFFQTTPPSASVQLIVNAINNTFTNCNGLIWEHLSYAYMVENTRVLDVFRRVIQELLHGEKLGLMHEDTQQWLRTTEALWYTDPAPLFIGAVASHIRPDLGASRRNAYQRMFGMDLNHGMDGGGAYPYPKSETANNDFVSMFEEFLREVWIAMINVTNFSGPKPTDDAKIANLATRLHDMLMSRRVYGTISLEEFKAICMLQWFDLTLSDEPRGSNLPIIVDLRAEAASPEERLFKIAQRVGLPAHGLSKSYLQIAFPISRILILLETAAMNDVTAVQALYTPGSQIESDMRTIIMHWSVISGRDMKAGKIAPS